MIAAKEALMLGGVAIVAYLAFKPTEGEGFGGAGGEGVEKKEPSEAGDIIYNLPEQVDYSSVIQELLSGQPTFEEVFPERDPIIPLYDPPTKKIDVPTEPPTGFEAKKESFLNWVQAVSEGKEPLMTLPGGKDKPFMPELGAFTKSLFEKKTILTTEDVGITTIPRQVQEITTAVFKPEERGIPTYNEEGEIESLKKTARHYGEQTPGYLATGVYERMSGALKVLGPTHPGSSYYKTTGYTPPTSTGGRILKKRGRSLRVGEFRKKYDVPSDYTYPVTRRIKVTN